MDKQLNQRYVILKALEKVLKDFIRDSNAMVLEQMEELAEETGADRAKVDINGEGATISLCGGSETRIFRGSGSEFQQFMLENGYADTAIVVDERWTENVSVIDGRVVLNDTGEVVPGTWVETKQTKPYIKVTNMDAQKILDSAHMLITSDVDLLEAPNGD